MVKVIEWDRSRKLNYGEDPFNYEKNHQLIIFRAPHYIDTCMACAVDAILEVVENLSCWFHECQMLKLPSFSSVRRCDELEWVV